MTLTDADRELVYEQLASHAAADRLTVEELERRVAVVANAQTREEAAEVLADLPALAPAPAGTARQRQRWAPWRRGHGDAERPQIGWQPTGERFRDPGSGRVMRVWVDPGGGRHYVPDE
jgi:Domain of unknown function (DUF1707)